MYFAFRFGAKIGSWMWLAKVLMRNFGRFEGRLYELRLIEITNSCVSSVPIVRVNITGEKSNKFNKK